MYYPDEELYIKLSAANNIVPIFYEYPADTETPITVFQKVAYDKQAYLLESVEGAERLARYSFIGIDPLLNYSYSAGTGQLLKNDKLTSMEGDPFQHMADIMSRFQTPLYPQALRFYGGAVGYFGYDLVRCLERLPLTTKDDLFLPQCCFMIARILLIFDHVRHTLGIVINSTPGSTPLTSYSEAIKQIESIIAKLKQTNPPLDIVKKPGNPASIPMVTSNMTPDEFISKVQRAKEYIADGDILQVVLSQRFSVPYTDDPFQVYRRLRSINPSPYLYYLNFGDLTIAGSSPEMLVRVEDGRIETRPIAGTRPRGTDPAEDEQLSLEMLKDPKERAEHVMLVDLGRNDIGRVSTPGSVEVKQFMDIEKYSHVMHLVSSVQGQLQPQYSGFDALKACFPAGTVSGAPKVRAMEIIEELESTRRGPYAGAIGYLGFNGNLDTAITIRTIVFHKGLAHVQAGAGIVADSQPELEYRETLNKAQALLQTLYQPDENKAPGRRSAETGGVMACCS